MKTLTYPVGLSTCGADQTRSFFAACREAGIACVEISDNAEKIAQMDLAAVVACAEEEGVAVASLHLPFSQEMDISRLDPAPRESTLAYHTALMKRAAAAGIKTFVIHPSSEPISDEERPQRMAQAKESLATLTELALSLGATLAVEDLPRSCLGNCTEDMLELLSAHPALRSCLDTNHLLGEDTAAYVRRVGDRIVTTHVSDFDFINERHWLPGEGKQDFLAILEALSDAGYKGPWLYEVGLSTPSTITRPRPLTHRDIAENAGTLLSGARPAAFGTPPEGLGMWG
jgi:sugar phosphate isomerase/epimerase